MKSTLLRNFSVALFTTYFLPTLAGIHGFFGAQAQATMPGLYGNRIIAEELNHLANDAEQLLIDCAKEMKLPTSNPAEIRKSVGRIYSQFEFASCTKLSAIARSLTSLRMSLRTLAISRFGDANESMAEPLAVRADPSEDSQLHYLVWQTLMEEVAIEQFRPVTAYILQMAHTISQPICDLGVWPELGRNFFLDLGLGTVKRLNPSERWLSLTNHSSLGGRAAIELTEQIPLAKRWGGIFPSYLAVTLCPSKVDSIDSDNRISPDATVAERIHPVLLYHRVGTSFRRVDANMRASAGVPSLLPTANSSKASHTPVGFGDHK